MLEDNAKKKKKKKKKKKPMRYALISDIHANLPALEAVWPTSRPGGVGHVPPRRPGGLRALARRDGGAARASAGSPGIAGNYDSTVATDYKHCGCRLRDPRAGRAVAPELRLDAAARLARDESVPRRSAVPHRPAPGGGHRAGPRSFWSTARPRSTRSTGPRTAPTTSACRWRVMPARSRAT